MFVKKLSINILTLYEMFYKGLRRGILIFYANTFKLLTSKHMRLQKGGQQYAVSITVYHGRAAANTGTYQSKNRSPRRDPLSE